MNRIAYFVFFSLVLVFDQVSLTKTLFPFFLCSSSFSSSSSSSGSIFLEKKKKKMRIFNLFAALWLDKVDYNGEKDDSYHACQALDSYNRNE
jgi:hypothetical protein